MEIKSNTVIMLLRHIYQHKKPIEAHLLAERSRTSRAEIRNKLNYCIIQNIVYFESKCGVFYYSLNLANSSTMQVVRDYLSEPHEPAIKNEKLHPTPVVEIQHKVSSRSMDFAMQLKCHIEEYEKAHAELLKVNTKLREDIQMVRNERDSLYKSFVAEQNENTKLKEEISGLNHAQELSIKERDEALAALKNIPPAGNGKQFTTIRLENMERLMIKLAETWDIK